MAIKLDLLEVENIYNKDGEQTLNLTGDQGIVVSGDVTLSQGSYYFKNGSDATQRHGFVADEEYAFEGVNLRIQATQKLYLDGGSNTYITESSSDTVRIYTGGTSRAQISSAGIESGGNVYTGTSSSFRNYAGDWTATIGTTNKDFNFYNTADSVTCMSLSHTGDLQVTGDIRNINSYQQGTVSAANPALKAVLLAHAPESNTAVIHPYFFNDLANFRARGGTINYGGLSSTPSDGNTDIMFHASALTNSISNSNISGSTWTIELKDFPRTLFYGTRIGISFGSTSFSPSSMVIEYSTDNGSSYTAALTSSVRNDHYHTYVQNGGSGDGVDAIKFTIGKYSSYSPRVMNIYAYNYDSRGMTEYFLDKAGGTLYGNLSMNSAGFTLDGNTITGIDDSDEFTNDDSHIMTSAAVEDKILSYSYGTGSGDMLLGTSQDITAHKEFQDNIQLRLGSGADIKMQHTGSHGYIDSFTGDLYIRNTIADQHIYLKADDGAGSNTVYIDVDGDNQRVQISKPLVLSSGSAVSSIKDEDNMASDSDTALATQQSIKAYVDSSVSSAGGGDVTLAGTQTFTGSKTFSADVILQDNVELEFGTDSDIKMKFDGSDLVTTVPTGSSFLIGTNGGTPHDNNGTADFAVDVNTNPRISLYNNQVQFGGSDMNWTSYFAYDGNTKLGAWDNDISIFTQGGGSATAKTIHIRPQAAGGTTTTVATFNGDTGTTLTGATKITGGALSITGDGSNATTLTESSSGDFTIDAVDDIRLDAGGNDVVLKAGGTEYGRLSNSSADFIIQNITDDKDISFRASTGGTTSEYFRLDGAGSLSIFSKHAQFVDNATLILGTGSDLQIYHDGNHSYIKDGGVGHLQILSSQLQINNAGNTENMITAAEDGSVTLFNDGSAKLATSSTGIDVTGEVKGDSLDIDGNADISGQLVLPQTSTTIGGSNTGNASLLIGSSSNGIGIDTNEIVSKGDHLYIGAATNDKSIIFRTDATVNVLTLDSSQDATFTGDVRLPQSGKLYLWTGHDSNYLRYDLWTGSASAGMTIKNTAADGEVYLWSGNTLALTLNDSQNATFAGDILVNTATAGGYIQIDQSDDSLKLADVNKLKLGIGNDLQIYHDGSNSYIRTQGGGTGNLIFTQNIDGADMIFKCDDGAGATTNYFLLDGGGVLTRFYKKLRAQDNVNIEAGSSGDVKIKHDGNHSYITNDTGTLYLQSNEADGDILFRADDGTGSSTTDYFRIDGSDVIMKAHKSIRFLDNVKATFGNSDDLQIYHDGSNSYINEVGNLDLYIQTNGNNMFLRNNANGDTFVAMNTGSRNVQLRMSNSTKLETTAYGVKTFYAATSNTDGDAAGDIVNLGESTTVAGKIYYYTSSGSWELADADAESTAKGMLAVALGTSSNTHGMLIRGMVTLDHDPGTIADTLFLSTSAGAATATAPSGTGDIVRVIGYSLNSTNGQIYFNPDGAFVEVTAG